MAILNGRTQCADTWALRNSRPHGKIEGHWQGGVVLLRVVVALAMLLVWLVPRPILAQGMDVFGQFIEQAIRMEQERRLLERERREEERRTRQEEFQRQDFERKNRDVQRKSGAQKLNDTLNRFSMRSSVRPSDPERKLRNDLKLQQSS